MPVPHFLRVWVRSVQIHKVQSSKRVGLTNGKDVEQYVCAEGVRAGVSKMGNEIKARRCDRTRDNTRGRAGVARPRD